MYFQHNPFCKANSPSRNWIINSNKFTGGRPPYPRRGSNTPVSSLALNSYPPLPPNRSRSLDGLLDSTEPIAAVSEATIHDQVPSKSCDNIDRDSSDSSDKETDPNSLSNKVDNFLDAADSDNDKSSIYSNSSDSKRKRNFMDRCVNKVRSFIKK
ncbi:unnamed protein product [Psylliodes chrysocephalus]|uniref:Uncharacterized protein n=1 Tax=Psylliodes chrysocephalus TaxID=3402493 RepID=A0A9P0GGG0_9CUCU|nr:unnamed protein product [Psylliodes chrysocephala]